MKFWLLLFGFCVSATVLAASDDTSIPSNQILVSVNYSSNGKQTGCGLRATGNAEGNLSLNILVTVFSKGAGITFGVIKVVARKILTKDGMPLLQDGQITYAELGEIKHAWIASNSGKQALIYKDGETSHNDAYMVNTEFASTVDLLIAMSQENFKVGLNRKEEGIDEVFQFNQQISQTEAGKFTVCLNKLRQAIADERVKESF